MALVSPLYFVLWATLPTVIASQWQRSLQALSPQLFFFSVNVVHCFLCTWWKLKKKSPNHKLCAHNDTRQGTVLSLPPRRQGSSSVIRVKKEGLWQENTFTLQIKGCMQKGVWPYRDPLESKPLCICERKWGGSPLPAFIPPTIYSSVSFLTLPLSPFRNWKLLETEKFPHLETEKFAQLQLSGTSLQSN
jgi:hypothetical protein